MGNEKDDEPKYEWKDYIAFIVAMLQTVFLPYMILIIVLLALIIFVISLS